MLANALRNGSHPVNRVFDRLVNENGFAPPARAAWSAVPLCVWEDEQNVYVEADVPGISEQDLDLSVQDNLLILRGQRKCEQPAACDPRRYGQFEQRLLLPKTVDPAQVKAKLTNGVLRITFGKRVESLPRKIDVQSQ